MSIVKTIEIFGNSKESFEDATKNAVKETAKTVRNIKSVWVKEQKALVTGDTISEYRVDVKISFLVEDQGAK